MTQGRTCTPTTMDRPLHTTGTTKPPRTTSLGEGNDTDSNSQRSTGGRGDHVSAG